MQETWSTRDLPVLAAVVEYLDDKVGMDFPDGNDIAELLDMDVEDVGRALRTLDGEYVEVQLADGGPGSWSVASVTSSARRVVGQWPTAERAVDQLIGELEKSAAEEQDPTRKDRLHAAAATIRDLARDVATDVMAKVLVGSLGMG
jgi:hypothetical protein